MNYRKFHKNTASPDAEDAIRDIEMNAWLQMCSALLTINYHAHEMAAGHADAMMVEFRKRFITEEPDSSPLHISQWDGPVDLRNQCITMLRSLVREGNRFRKTPIVDDDFPQMRDTFDKLLSDATNLVNRLDAARNGGKTSPEHVAGS